MAAALQLVFMQRLSRWSGFAVAVCAVLASSSIAQASIVAPTDLSVGHAEKILASLGESSGGAGASDAAHQHHRPEDGPNHRERPYQNYRCGLPGLPGGSSTSSSSLTGANPSSSAVLFAVSEIVTAPSLVGRIAAERAMFVPDAPGTDLLRPPRIQMAVASSALRLIGC